jgi:kynurenine 3-monooxygenase
LTLPNTGVFNFLQENFPDMVYSIQNLEKQFAENPASPLLNIKCSPWHHEDKVLLIGDASHATVPFYGQGMNAGFEDYFDWTSRQRKFERNNRDIFQRATTCRFCSV